MIRTILALAIWLCAGVAYAQNGSKPLVEFIGMASMADDGTITMRLARTSDGDFVDGTFTYKPDNPKYAEILQHLQGLKPGETKPVRPWPG